MLCFNPIVAGSSILPAGLAFTWYWILQVEVDHSRTGTGFLYIYM